MRHIPTVCTNANESVWMCLITDHVPSTPPPPPPPPIQVVPIILGVGLTLIVVILIVVFVRVCIVRRAKRPMYAACEYIILLNISPAGELKWNTDCIYVHNYLPWKWVWLQHTDNISIHLTILTTPWKMCTGAFLPQEARLPACWQNVCVNSSATNHLRHLNSSTSVLHSNGAESLQPKHRPCKIWNMCWLITVLVTKLNLISEWSVKSQLKRHFVVWEKKIYNCVFQ